MLALRKRLRAFSIVWLLGQAASLFVLLPSDWMSPQALAGTTKDCLETTPAEQCPMHDLAGAPCPMHQGGATGDSTRECAMRGLANGPGAALASLFSVPGILLDSSEPRIDINAALLAPVTDRTPDAPTSLDTPPPRS